jgi:MerR family transcriptional regulator, thiopeptide resistance regulator
MKRRRVQQATYRVQAFAELAGVTVRTLHHYDRLALLKPKRTGAGYRLYGAPDLERVEQIVALKFLGLPLKQIKAVLDRDSRSLGEVLRAQRRALEEKRRRLDRAINAIADAERAIVPGRPPEAALLRRIIEVIDMSDQQEDMRKYYSDDAWAALSQRREAMTDKLRDIAMEGTRKWMALYGDVIAALDADPAGPVAQALVDRWQGLIDEFTGGNQGIQEGLGRAWQDRANWSEAMKKNSEPFGDPRVWEFIRNARAARSPSRG